MLQEVNSSFHRALRLELMKGQHQLHSKQIEGISQAAVISSSTDARPTFRTGAIGGEVGR